MGLSDTAYQALKSVVGADYVSRDPEVCQAYSRGGFGQDLYDVGRVDASIRVWLRGCRLIAHRLSL